jgi:hypothetical protein
VKLAEREGPSTAATASLENPSKTGPSARVKILLGVLRRILIVNARPPSRLRRGNRRPGGGAGRRRRPVPLRSGDEPHWGGRFEFGQPLAQRGEFGIGRPSARRQCGLGRLPPGALGAEGRLKFVVRLRVSLPRAILGGGGDLMSGAGV